MAFCSKCGTQINEGVNFCPKCGQTVGNNVSTQQQETNPSQQHYEEQDEKGLQFWLKILLIIFWPIGFIMAIIFKSKKKALKARDAFFYSCAGLGVAIGVFLTNNVNGCSSNSLLETATKKLMIQKFKEEGSTLIVKDISLVQESDNEYSGLANCEIDGEEAQLSLKVVTDGMNIQAEWELTDIENDGSEEAEGDYESDDYSNVAEIGYKEGYQAGFEWGGTIHEDTGIHNCYTNYYPAPTTPEEKKQFEVFAENYKRGFRDGKNAR